VLSIALDLRGHGESQGVFGKLISGSRSKKMVHAEIATPKGLSGNEFAENLGET
jgi:hypothetical protein